MNIPYKSTVCGSSNAAEELSDLISRKNAKQEQTRDDMARQIAEINQKLDAMQKEAEKQAKSDKKWSWVTFSINIAIVLMTLVTLIITIWTIFN